MRLRLARASGDLLGERPRALTLTRLQKTRPWRRTKRTRPRCISVNSSGLLQFHPPSPSSRVCW